MEKILKNERTEEQTNENERALKSEREQKFMNEILSTTREIEENLPFFPHKNRMFRRSLENIGTCYKQYFMGKNEEIIENLGKRQFPVNISVFSARKSD